jgi:hypothetical protein
VLLAACSKDKTTPTPAGSWQVDGQPQQSERVSITLGTPALNSGIVTIAIWQNFNTTASTGSAVVLTMNVPQRTGTYSLAGTSTSTSAAYSAYSSAGQGTGLYTATSGSVTISTLTSNSISGTFTFTGTELFNSQHTKQITNGQFNTSF